MSKGKEDDDGGWAQMNVYIPGKNNHYQWADYISNDVSCWQKEKESASGLWRQGGCYTAASCLNARAIWSYFFGKCQTKTLNTIVKCLQNILRWSRKDHRVDVPVKQHCSHLNRCKESRPQRGEDAMKSACMHRNRLMVCGDQAGQWAASSGLHSYQALLLMGAQRYANHKTTEHSRPTRPGLKRRTSWTHRNQNKNTSVSTAAAELHTGETEWL